LILDVSRLGYLLIILCGALALVWFIAWFLDLKDYLTSGEQPPQLSVTPNQQIISTLKQLRANREQPFAVPVAKQKGLVDPHTSVNLSKNQLLPPRITLSEATVALTDQKRCYLEEMQQTRSPQHIPTIQPMLNPNQLSNPVNNFRMLQSIMLQQQQRVSAPRTDQYESLHTLESVPGRCGPNPVNSGGPQAQVSLVDQYENIRILQNLLQSNSSNLLYPRIYQGRRTDSFEPLDQGGNLLGSKNAWPNCSSNHRGQLEAIIQQIQNMIHQQKFSPSNMADSDYTALQLSAPKQEDLSDIVMLLNTTVESLSDDSRGFTPKKSHTDWNLLAEEFVNAAIKFSKKSKPTAPLLLQWLRNFLSGTDQGDLQVDNDAAAKALWLFLKDMFDDHPLINQRLLKDFQNAFKKPMEVDKK